MIVRRLVLFVLLAGCEWVRLPTDDSIHDADGDGYDALHDCNDFNANVHPAAAELCNGIDNDCDGSEDDAADASVWYPDADGDGYGDAAGWVTACDAPLGFVPIAADCDDDDADFHPGATEDDCTDPNDYDCDGRGPERDIDGDGWAACEDCDDDRADAAPGAPELCNGLDDDCDGVVDNGLAGTTWYADADGDGWGDPSQPTDACTRPPGTSADGTDCDDTSAAVHPDAPEACNAADDDCDGVVDENDRFGNGRWYIDADGDGYGDPSDWVASCDPQEGRISIAEDCDDTNATIYPLAPEHCDGVDEDCNGVADDLPDDPFSWYRDADRDGYGNPAMVQYSCTRPDGYIADGTDCDDADRTINPGADETCGGGDEDCDGTVDEDDAVDAPTWYADADADGYGDAADSVTACSQPTDRIADGTDCDDRDPLFHPGALEVDCTDNADYNCDGSAGHDDADADGWMACEDCNDADASVNPAVEETCNGLDDDCDEDIDEDAVDAPVWYTDLDGDGYGGETSAVSACAAPSGYLSVGGDCDDTDVAVSPRAFESCTTPYDDDCDGVANGADAAGCSEWYPDADADGFGGADGACLCAPTDPYVASSSTDCDDSDATVNPDGAEVCGDGVDNDCDSSAIGCGVAGDEPLADAEAEILGAVAGDEFGFSLAGLGDIDGDGDADVVAGAPLADGAGTDAGAAYVYTGPLPSGAGASSSALATFTGEAALDEAGATVAAGDFDGDGTTDLVIAAVGEDSGGSNGGAVYLVLGPLTGGVALGSADGKRIAEDTDDWVGCAVASGGDADGDGDDELVVGAARETIESLGGGAVYVFDAPVLGTDTVASAAGILLGEHASDYFGRTVAGVGDTDGDGFDDFVVGAYGNDGSSTNAGAAYLFRGPVTGTVSAASADATLRGIAHSDNAGYAVGGGGDTDGDGYADFVVGAPANDDAGSGAGAAYVVRGPASGVSTLGSDVTLLGEMAGDRAGISLALLDVNADGFADVAVGGDGGTHGDTGAVWVAYGPLSGESSLGDADAVAIGEASGDSVGDSVSSAGDTDGDGYTDLLVGAYGQDATGTDAGAIYVLTGGPGY